MANPGSTAGAKAQAPSGVVTKVRQRAAWLALVVIVPLIALLIMVVIALQVLGVPVWGNAVKWLNHSSASAAPSQVEVLKQQLAAAETKAKKLNSDNQSMAQKLAAEQRKEHALAIQTAQLQQAMTQATSAISLAKQEAAVMKTMNPQAAASVLDKLTTAQAAAVIAAMSPADAGPILSNINPAKAGQLLSQAAQIMNQANVTSTGNGTGVSTSNNSSLATNGNVTG